MKTYNFRQSGFSAVELVIIVVVVVVIGLLGYVAYNSFQNKAAESAEQSASESSTVNDVGTAPAINSDSDLESAEQLLDQTDVASGDDTKQLETSTAAF
jgi:Tfp pilus assembly protein PilV